MRSSENKNQFWKLQKKKKKCKTCNKNKSYKNPSIYKNSKNQKISRGEKKKIPHRPTEEQREIYLGIATPF